MKITKNIPASIKARLSNVSKQTGMEYEDVLKYFAMERFLYRLSKSGYKNRFVLKGALLFTALGIENRRVTLDIDFLSYFDNKESSIVRVVKEISEISLPEDGVEFKTDTISADVIKKGAEYQGVRVKFKAFIGNTRIDMKIDFGFGDKIYSGPKNLKYPSLLDLPEPEIRSYPIESSVSEKFEAVIKIGEINSRLKDYYDIWLLIKSNIIKRTKLREAIKTTFENRGTDIPSSEKIFRDVAYNSTSKMQYEWVKFLERMGINNAPEKISLVIKEIQIFMRDILLDINREKEKGAKSIK